MRGTSKHQPFLICLLQLWQHATAAADTAPRQCIWVPGGPLSPSAPGGSEPSIFGSCPVVVDEATSAQKGKWEPWTRPPLCSTPRPHSQRPYCIYTHSSLAGSGSGISILTTPDLAAATAPLIDGLDPVWGLPSSSGAVPGAAGGRDRGDVDVQEPRFPPPYEVQSIAGKGKGVIANASIPAGELLFRERPVLVDMMTRPAYVNSQQHRTMLDRALARLSPPDRLSVKGLSYHNKNHILEGIMAANTFGITLNGMPHSGLYPRIARINHACRPNAFVRYRRSTLELEVVAYKDIEPGTELSVSYTPLNLFSKDRRQLLRRWRFDCACSLCSADHHVVETSDRNRQRVQDILEELDHADTRAALARGDGNNIVAARLSEIEGVMQEEGIEAQAGDVDAIAAELFLGAGDLGEARTFAQRAVRQLRVFAGADSERTEQAEAFLRRLDG